MYRNPKEIKTEVKMFFFYVMDGVIFFVTLALGVALLNRFNVNSVLSIIGYIFFGILGIFLALRTPRHPVERNLSLIIHIFKRDNNQYYDFQLDYSPSITATQLKEENDG